MDKMQEGIGWNWEGRVRSIGKFFLGLNLDLIWTYRCFFWKLHETSDKLPPPACPALLVF